MEDLLNRIIDMYLVLYIVCVFCDMVVCIFIKYIEKIIVNF